MRWIYWPVSVGLLSSSSLAFAEGESGNPAPASSAPARAVRERTESSLDEPATRRSGFTVGLSGGLLLGNVHGYPNDVTQIDVPEFEVNTGLGVSGGGALWFGGALADWLTVGLGVLGGGISGNGLEASGGSVLLRIEAFPAFYRGGVWRDVGLVFSAGTGGYAVKRDGQSVAEGAGTSAVGIGAFIEPWRLWRFATGPQLEYGHQFSRSLSAHVLVIGWRVAFYAGP